MCFNCVGGLHLVSRDCKSQRRCNTCKVTHHSILDLNRDGSSKISTTAGTKSEGNVAKKRQTCASMHLSAFRVRLKVPPVTAWNDSKTSCVDTYAFLDEGSDVTLCSNKLLEKLEIVNAEPDPCTLQTVSGCTMAHDVRLTSLFVKGVNLTKSIDIINVLAGSNLPNLLDSISSDTDMHGYTYYRGFSLPNLILPTLIY